MNWFYQNEITLLCEAEGVLRYGIYKKASELTELKTISCDIQPYSNEEFYKEYGYYIEAEFNVYCDLDNDITEKNKVRFKDNIYEIKKIIQWNDYMILLIRRIENE